MSDKLLALNLLALKAYHTDELIFNYKSVKSNSRRGSARNQKVVSKYNNLYRLDKDNLPRFD